MKLKYISGKIIKIFLPLLLGIALLWYLYQEYSIREIASKFNEGVDYGMLLFSLVFGLAANITRGFRWAMLIDSLGKPVNKKNVIFAVLGNYAINIAIPFRAGEIWRCGMTAKYEKVPFTKLLGTLFVDRIMDMVVVVSLTFCLFVFNIGFFHRFFSENPPLVLATLYNVFSSVWTYVLLVVSAALVWLMFVKLAHLTVVRRAKEMVSNVWEGVRSIWKIKRKALFILQTLLIWGGYFLYFYVAFFAFGFTENLGLRIALITFAMSSIGVAVPVQGGIGVWHFMVIYTLVAFGVHKADAAAFAFVVFAVQSVWLVMMGLFGIVALPLANRKEKATQ